MQSSRGGFIMPSANHKTGALCIIATGITNMFIFQKARAVDFTGIYFLGEEDNLLN